MQGQTPSPNTNEIPPPTPSSSKKWKDMHSYIYNTKVTQGRTNESLFFGPAGILLIYVLLGTTMAAFLRFVIISELPLDA